jgi:hypothetical protein
MQTILNFLNYYKFEKVTSFFFSFLYLPNIVCTTKYIDIKDLIKQINISASKRKYKKVRLEGIKLQNT